MKDTCKISVKTLKGVNEANRLIAKGWQVKEFEYYCAEISARLEREIPDLPAVASPQAMQAGLPAQDESLKDLAERQRLQERGITP